MNFSHTLSIQTQKRRLETRGIFSGHPRYSSRTLNPTFFEKKKHFPITQRGHSHPTSPKTNRITKTNHPLSAEIIRKHPRSRFNFSIQTLYNLQFVQNYTLLGNKPRLYFWEVENRYGEKRRYYVSSGVVEEVSLIGCR